jgi:hypothetical protein
MGLGKEPAKALSMYKLLNKADWISKGVNPLERVVTEFNEVNEGKKAVLLQASAGPWGIL